jgi:hypothetical protein
MNVCRKTTMGKNPRRAPVPDCSTYEGPRSDVRLRVLPPGMSQTFTVPISIGRNEGLCPLQVHPQTGD